MAKLTPSRGFAAELATSSACCATLPPPLPVAHATPATPPAVILVASQHGLPTSSSQCIVGGIVGGACRRFHFARDLTESSCAVRGLRRPQHPVLRVPGRVMGLHVRCAPCFFVVVSFSLVHPVPCCPVIVALVTAASACGRCHVTFAELCAADACLAVFAQAVFAPSVLTGKSVIAYEDGIARVSTGLLNGYAGSLRSTGYNTSNARDALIRDLDITRANINSLLPARVPQPAGEVSSSDRALVSPLRPPCRTRRGRSRCKPCSRSSCWATCTRVRMMLSLNTPAALPVTFLTGLALYQPVLQLDPAAPAMCPAASSSGRLLPNVNASARASAPYDPCTLPPAPGGGNVSITSRVYGITAPKLDQKKMTTACHRPPCNQRG